ncbi:MAG: hemerythrin domain-containing protein [Patescibacteria group bacterium]
MDLIAVLKSEHKIILKILGVIDALAKENKSVLSEAIKLEKVLAIHLKKEDGMIYPVFNGSKEEKLKKLGRLFSEQMKTYAVEIADCLSEIKKAKGNLDSDLSARFEKSSSRIFSRVSIEETILFPAYVKYFSK